VDDLRLESVKNRKQILADVCVYAQFADLRTALTILRTVDRRQEAALVQVGNKELHDLFSAAET